MRLDLVRLNIDECVTEIMGEAGFSNPNHRKFRRTRDALEISIVDLAKSPCNKTGHLHLARVKNRRLVLQTMNWEAILAAVSFGRSTRGLHVPPDSIRENALVMTVARVSRVISMLEEDQVQVLTAVMRIVDTQIRHNAEEPGASVEEIVSYLSSKGVDAPVNLESSLDDLTPVVLERSNCHPGQRRFTAAS